LTYEGTLSFIRDPVTGLFDTTQGGVQRSTGVELDVMARPGQGFLITGTVGTLDASVVTDPVYAPGRLLGGAPRRRGNLWVAWESQRGLGLGAGVFHQSEFKEFTSSNFLLRGFTTVDAMASYRVSPRVIVRLNGKNLANERYYLNGAGGFLAYPAPPRHVVGSLAVRF
jgi:outer membrane receptor protein involved in Fe transport